jgi:hypothetical protein
MKKNWGRGWGDIPTLCRFVFMVNVSWWRDKSLRNEEGKVTGSGLFGHVAEERSQYNVMRAVPDVSIFLLYSHRALFHVRVARDELLHKLTLKHS